MTLQRRICGLLGAILVSSRLLVVGIAVVVSAVMLAQCSGQVQTPEEGDAAQDSSAEPQGMRWVSCLPPQLDPNTMPEILCPSPAPGQFMIAIPDSELSTRIQEYIKKRHGDAEVTGVHLTLERGSFLIQGQLLRPFKATIQVSGGLVVRNGRIEAEAVKGKVGFVSVPASYMAEAAAEVNEALGSFFRDEYGIRVTHVEILPGALHLTGEDLR